MNSLLKKIFKNFSYTVVSNFVTLVVSSMVILFIPKVLGIEEYGYFQLYIFYSGYIGLLHFGWNDGIYLRLGGLEYSKIDKIKYYSQFIQLVCFQFFLGTLIWISVYILIEDSTRIFVLNATIFCMFISNIRIMLLFILQATNRIKEFMIISVCEKIFYIILIILFYFFENLSLEFLVISDLIGKTISLIFAIYFCKEIVLRKFADFVLNITETISNIKIGINLVIANIASLLVIGVVRFTIEHLWDVEIFGQVSLILSITSMLMIFINALGIVLFPVLRNLESNKMGEYYIKIRVYLMLFLIPVLLLYYPIEWALLKWIPQYYLSAYYLVLLFPIFVSESKMAILANTYLKVLRKERIISKINIFSLLLSVVFVITFGYLLKNLILLIFSINVCLALRVTFTEWYLSKILQIKLKGYLLAEIILILFFSISGWLLEWKISIFMTFIIVAIYLTFNVISLKKINQRKYN